MGINLPSGDEGASAQKTPVAGTSCWVHLQSFCFHDYGRDWGKRCVVLCFYLVPQRSALTQEETGGHRFVCVWGGVGGAGAHHHERQRASSVPCSTAKPRDSLCKDVLIQLHVFRFLESSSSWRCCLMNNDQTQKVELHKLILVTLPQISSNRMISRGKPAGKHTSEGRWHLD